jgi:hypothetical protein
MDSEGREVPQLDEEALASILTSIDACPWQQALF